MRRRPSARLLIIDPAGRVLLFRFVHKNGALAGQDYWATPGGGLLEGETFEQAAIRELREETGIRVKAVGPEVGKREFVLQLPDGEHVVSDERFFRIDAKGMTVSSDEWTAHEREVMAAHRWWSRDELARTTETVWPENLIAMLPDAGTPTERRAQMPERVSIDDAIALIARDVRPHLIAIDGLPCSGKSTMVARMRECIDIDCIALDDFVLAEKDWPSRDRPAFPFEYIRYHEFLDAVQALASNGECSYLPFDWDTLSVSAAARAVRLTKPVVIEGVSALVPALCDLYGLRIFVESNRATTLEAAVDRGVGAWHDEWRDLFLPSANIYMQTRPETRADLLVAGRGCLSSDLTP